MKNSYKINFQQVGVKNMNKILVTGGAGFIGSHLCERLKNEGNEVTSLDNYFTGSTDNHVEDVEYITGSTNNIRSILKGRIFDTVYHLGEYSRVEQSFDDFELVWKFNKLGTFEVLQYVNDIKAKLIYAGSSTKFASRDVDYIQSPYAWSKESNTDFVKLFCEWNKIDYAITYFYNVYGPREIETGEYATVIAKFNHNMKLNKPLTVVSPGIQKRNFTHIDDIISGLILVGEKGFGDEHGIGSDQSFTILQVAEFFGGSINMIEARKGNRLSATVRTDKTKQLGWNCKKDLKTYINNLKNNKWNNTGII